MAAQYHVRDKKSRLPLADLSAKGSLLFLPSLFQQGLIHVAAAQMKASRGFAHGFLLRPALFHELHDKLLRRLLRHTFRRFALCACDDEDKFAAWLFLAVVREKAGERAAAAGRAPPRAATRALSVSFRWCGAS